MTCAAIAIQNLFENLSMLTLVTCYTAVSYLRLPVNGVAVGFGLFLSFSIGALTLVRRNPGKT